MKLYTIKATCSICGGPGMAMTYGDVYGQHRDPSTCRYYLNLKAKKLRQQEKELENKEGK